MTLGQPLDPSALIDTAERPTFSTWERDAELTARLNTIDWDFSARGHHSNLEALHPYPAKFIAEIPRSLIACLAPPQGTVVFDPFCGSGTTLAEAQRAGFASVGSDLNPIACLIARVRTSHMPAPFKPAVSGIIRRAEGDSSVIVPHIPNLDHWFKEDVQLALSRLTRAIDQVLDPAIRDGLQLALSSIIVRVSNQDSDTRYAAVEKRVSYRDVFSSFERACTRLYATLAERDYILAPAQVLEVDTLKLDPSKIGRRVGLVVTSPPYPNAYEYWLYHKYRMWWLGKDPIAVKEQEIGARAHFFKKNRHTVHTFAEQMSAAFDLLRKALLPDSYTCFVVGRSIIHGECVDNADVIRRVGTQRGFRTVANVEREILRHKKSFNLSHASIKTETIVVLQRDSSQ